MEAVAEAAPSPRDCCNHPTWAGLHLGAPGAPRFGGLQVLCVWLTSHEMHTQQGRGWGPPRVAEQVAAHTAARCPASAGEEKLAQYLP